MKIVIKDTENLFKEWNELSQDIKSLNGLIQNEMTVDVTQILEWHTLVNAKINELTQLKRKILKHINKINN